MGQKSSRSLWLRGLFVNLHHLVIPVGLLAISAKVFEFSRCGIHSHRLVMYITVPSDGNKVVCKE